MMIRPGYDKEESCIQIPTVIDGTSACPENNNAIGVKSSDSASGLFRRILAEGGCANKNDCGTAFVCVGPHGERLEGLDDKHMVLVAREFVKVTAVRQAKGKTRIILIKTDIASGGSVTLLDTGQANWINFAKGNIQGKVSGMLEGTGLTRFENAILAAVMRTTIASGQNDELHFYVGS